ncbi:hypothetical protein AaE_008066 [Aphanomyces astaci]|uniref:Uncharacterized protein n=1 Tax=Aphanomyces astaci TaxID=112090 RepID=A0A6A5ABU4_APHAT|nr:hypothetical protein AaE_008066 [Aphanomyces astaci]
MGIDVVLSCFKHMVVQYTKPEFELTCALYDCKCAFDVTSVLFLLATESTSKLCFCIWPPKAQNVLIGTLAIGMDLDRLLSSVNTVNNYRDEFVSPTVLICPEGYSTAAGHLGIVVDDAVFSEWKEVWTALRHLALDAGFEIGVRGSSWRPSRSDGNYLCMQILRK